MSLLKGVFDMTVVERVWNAINGFDWGNGKKYYCLTIDEYSSLVEHARDSFLRTNSAFKWGFIKGMRYQKAQEKKKRKAVKK